MSKISQTVLKVAKNLGSGFNGGWALFITALPVALFIGYLIVYISNKSARNKGRVIFSAFSDLCTYLFLAFSLFSCLVNYDIETGVLVIGVALILKAGYMILYGVLSAFPAYKEKKKKSNAIFNQEYFDLGENFSQTQKNYSKEPKKGCCYTQESAEILNEEYPAEVRLDHIFSVIERLKNASLGAGDRLEINKYEELLTVYKNKNYLSGEEAQTLNDILASLLKFMAKYEV